MPSSSQGEKVGETVFYQEGHFGVRMRDPDSVWESVEEIHLHIGRVVGNSVMETRFRMNFGENLQVGEMLVVENSISEVRYLVRVMDVEHGADAE